MKVKKSTTLRRQWEELLAGWPSPEEDNSPARPPLEASGVRFLVPIASLAGAGMKRSAESPVCCDLISHQDRPCMLICAGRRAQTFRLDSVALKKILRAQQIALYGGLPIGYFFLGDCGLAPDRSEIFPDLEAAGVLIQKAADANKLGVSQFVYTEKIEGIGGLLAQALSRRRLIDSGSTPPPYVEFLAWLEELGPLAQLADPLSNSDPTDVMPLNPSEEYDSHHIIATLVDEGSFVEYRAEYGRTLICGYGRIGNLSVGIVANQRKHVREAGRPFEFGGVIYSESADKGARFVLDCNQNGLPLLFLHDVNGFMVGRDAEVSGIIRSGAKMVNAVANSVVPKISLILGGSYGAGNYAMCGKAYDPLFIFAWPTARYAVMGGEQAARTLCDLQIRHAESSGKKLSDKERIALFENVKKTYDSQLDPRYAAARLWIDNIVFPAETRTLLFHALRVASYRPPHGEFKTGVLQT